MNKKEKVLIDYLVKKYNPIGIVLFGSRVTQNVHQKTDWDLFVFTNKKEKDVNDFAELCEWQGELLEVTPISKKEMNQKDFILDTAMHPLKDFKILHDNSEGVLTKICERTKKVREMGQNRPTGRQKDLAIKILTKYIRKVESRENQQEVIFFAASQFFIYAVRYWFQFHKRWPEPIHQALATIKQNDPIYESLLRRLFTTDNSEPKELLEAMKNIRANLQQIGAQ